MKLQEEAENDLNQAMPIMESAIKALDSLNQKDISEIRTFSSPPALVVFTLEAISLLLGNKSDWDSIKRMLNLNFIETLKTFPRDNISSKTLNKLRNKISSNPSFTPEKVGQQNYASKSLCFWVFAIDNYSKVVKEVQPKKDKLDKMNNTMNESLKTLASARERLQQEMYKVKELEESLKNILEEKEKLGRELSVSDIRIQRSSILTGGLKEEHDRWKQKSLEFTNSIKNLLGDAYLSSAFISYCGPFTADFRKNLLSLWLSKCQALKLPVNSNFSLQAVMSSPFQIQDWKIASLPSDSFSIDSAVIATNSQKWPLIIDPQQQAKKWIKGIGALNIKEKDRDLFKKLENSIRHGNGVIIEDIGETLITNLDNLISKHFIHEGSHVSVMIGDAQVYLHNNFQLYFTTKLPNPHYLPEIAIKLCIVNFTVTAQSLQEHLLADVVRLEEPKIEARNIELIHVIANDQKKIQEIEENILKSLSESTGNILDDGKLIISLKNSKELSYEIVNRMQLAEETRKIIEATRENYKDVAVRGSLLYFTIANLSSIDSMYQYSLQYFSTIFAHTISNEPKGMELKERIPILINAVTSKVYSIIGAGLFSKHHFVFGLMICISIEKQSGIVSDTLWELFIKGLGLLETPNKPKPEFLTEKSWNFLQVLEAYPEFSNICTEICNNFINWQTMNSLITVPSPYDKALPFHKLLLIKALKEDCLISCINQYIQQTFKVEKIDIFQILKSISNKTPIIIILKQGVDPLRLIQKIAKTHEMDEKIDIVSLGKGQGEKAQKLIEQAIPEGRWVILQNCHLAKSWMQSLEDIIVNLEKKNINENFKLVITSMPCEYFSVGILHRCLKIALEPPSGIKSNILRAIPIVSSDKKNDEVNKILMNLCVFHAIVQERNKFGSLGWNIRYDFNESDLEISSSMIYILADEDNIPWDALKFIIGEVNYGGRVTDELDRRLLMNILSIYSNRKIIDKEYIYEGTFNITASSDWEQFKTTIKAMPDNEDIEMLGLHSNAQIVFQLSELPNLLENILKMQPNISASNGNPDIIVGDIAKHLLEILPRPILHSELSGVVHNKLKNGVIDPMMSFLNHEIIRFNRLLNACRGYLQELCKALKGQVLMSEELESIYLALLNNSTPKIWLKLSYPSLKNLPSWIEDLINRVSFIRDWLKLPPISYWLSAFFFPQGFLTAVLQLYSRKYLVPIDKLSFAFDFLQGIEAEATEGVYIHGLWMEGCRWDFNEMELAEPINIYSQAPIIHFLPTQSPKKFNEDYSMPLYKNTERSGLLSTTGHSSNYIISIDTPTSVKAIHWVLRSAAYTSEANQ